jgi:2-polyprenyl-6-methoxyphenol hydroxylase-like FAD-dependent oxidoreductase
MTEHAEATTTCCIVGGGPAGVMLGLLLARAGVDVQVLEKHADFFRDFRGDTIHPSTMEALAELGLLDEFLALPHQEIRRLKLQIDDTVVDGPDFSRLPVRCPFIALIPQWDFLDFLSRQAGRHPAFHLRMSTEVVDVIEENGRIVGVRARTGSGELLVRADLVVAADGRHSTLRRCSDMPLDELGVPIDVLWFRVRKLAPEPEPVLGRIKGGSMLVTIDRGDYFQCGEIIPKGDFERIRQAGLPAFRRRIADVAPHLRASLEEITDWDQVKLLTVQIDRLRQWARPGLLCIGDAAHAMSPAGGVGINLAIQDAIATANLLAAKLRERRVGLADLQGVQGRREWPTRVTQNVQAFLHRRMFARRDGKLEALPFSWPLRTFLRLFAPLLRRIGARGVGLGVRPEHVETPEASGDAARFTPA